MIQVMESSPIAITGRWCVMIIDDGSFLLNQFRLNMRENARTGSTQLVSVF